MRDTSTGELRLASDVDDGRFRLDAIVPSWFVSIASHVVLFFVMSLVLRGCTTAGAVGPKASDGTFREVGLHASADADSGRPAGPGNAIEDGGLANAMTPDDNQAPPQPLPLPLIDDAAINDLLNLPDRPASPYGLPLLGPGPSSSFRTPSSASELIRRSGPSGSGGSGGGGGRGGAGGGDGTGLGETTFFDIAAKGSRFLYVLDRSGSMYDHNAIRVAKEELIASLSTLEQTQQFQVVFYNQSFIELRHDDERPGMQWATEINRTLARQFISSIQPDGGTDHVPALKKALRYQPEHLFFLTDADQPQLSARELHEIKTLNGGRTRIHCVEFGKGSELSSDNFMKKVARDNGGTYRYRDVTRFDRRLRQ
jgi:hypothetical protein